MSISTRFHRNFGCVIVLQCLLFVAFASAQAPPGGVLGFAPRLMQKVLEVQGGASISSVKDISASGGITYLWADEQVQGTVGVKWRKGGQLRFETHTAQLDHTLVIDGVRGRSQHSHRRSVELSPRTVALSGTFVFPGAELELLLNDSSAILAGGEEVSLNGTDVIEITFSRSLPELKMMPGSGPVVIKYYLDPKTFLPVRRVDSVETGRGGEVERWIDYGAFQTIDGVLVPSEFSEFVAGQKTDTVSLTDIQINKGVFDADFKF